MSTTAARVSKLANVIIPIGNPDRALEFYTEALGLEKRADVPFGNGERWIEVAPAGAETPIALSPPGPGGDVGGKETGITLQTEDIEAYHAQLSAREVDVDAEITRPGGPCRRSSGSATARTTG